jgi:hypothetical protein
MQTEQLTMTAPTVQGLLSTWEQGSGSSTPERALLLLSAAFPGDSAVRDLLLGERDARLLALRERLFGSTMPSVVSCPACHAKLDIQLDVPDLLRIGKAGTSRVIGVSIGGLVLQVRLPSADDLLSLNASDGDEANARKLFDRCLLEARNGNDTVTSGDMPVTVMEEVGRMVSEADPLSDIQIHLDCPACKHGCDLPFAIAPYIWAEIDSWARRTLSEVHLIASAYGWGEQSILALSPMRRRYYIDLIATGWGSHGEE